MHDSTSRVLAAVRGAGSLLEIASTTPYERLLPNESFDERLRADFLRVGGAMRQAMDADGTANESESQRETADARGEESA